MVLFLPSNSFAEQVYRGYFDCKKNINGIEECDTNQNFETLISHLANDAKERIFRNAARLVLQKIPYQYGGRCDHETVEQCTQKLKRGQGLDCSGVINYLFKISNFDIIFDSNDDNKNDAHFTSWLLKHQANINNSKECRKMQEEQIKRMKTNNLAAALVAQDLSNNTVPSMNTCNKSDYAVSRPSEKTNKRSFIENPEPGTILAYNAQGSNKAHVVMVIDPYKCIAFNSTSYTAHTGPSGVQFHQIMKKENCFEGKWTGWDIVDQETHTWDAIYVPPIYDSYKLNPKKDDIFYWHYHK